MLKTEYLLEDIKSALINFQSHIIVNGKLNMLNGHIIGEDYYRQIFNIIFGYKLINENVLDPNAAVIDLVDHDKQIVMQVSATSTRQKIEHTLTNRKAKKYAGYEISFIFIGELNQRLSTYAYPDSVMKFDPKENIHDVVSILNRIKHLDYDKLKEVHELIMEQFHAGIYDDKGQLTSSLAKVIMILGKNDLQYTYSKHNRLPFQIEKKIKDNNLILYRDLIAEKNIYYSKVQMIYDSFTKESINTKEAVWERIAEFSREIQLTENLEGDLLFKKMLKACYEYIIDDPTIKCMEKDVVELCIKIVVVDAFLRCKFMRLSDEEDEYAFASRNSTKE